MELANKSKSFSEEAIKNSLPEYLKDLRSEVEKSKESAIKTNSEQLAKDFFEQGKNLISEADELTNPEVPSEKLNLGISKYEEAMESFEKARELSLSQSSGLITSSAELESDFLQIEKYQSSPSPKLVSLKNDHKIAMKNLNDGELKTGMSSIEKIRLDLASLKSEVLLPIAKQKAEKANEQISLAEKKLTNPANTNSESLDSLGLSKESYKKSIDLIGKERYYDSIEESNRVIELTSGILADKNLLASNLKDKKKSKTRDKNSNSESSSLNEKKPENEIGSEKKSNLKNDSEKKLIQNSKFTKYIVKKKDPPETLWMIAADKKNLGDKHKWKKIYEANKKRIKDPDKIFPNQVILIPKK